jgi:hypothetical protein
MNTVNDVKIAEFFGFQETSLGWFDNEGILSKVETDNTFDDLKFNTDWNWVMSVLNEISNRKDNKMGVVTLFGLGRTKLQCYIKDTLVHDIDIMGVSNINVSVEAIIAYIDWFNKN